MLLCLTNDNVGENHPLLPKIASTGSVRLPTTPIHVLLPTTLAREKPSGNTSDGTYEKASITFVAAHSAQSPRPSEICSAGACLSWHSNEGWQTTLNATFSRVSVAYSRLNGIILSYDFSSLSPSSQAILPTPNILSTLQTAIGVDNGGLSDVLALITDPNKLKLFPFYIYPVWIWGFLSGANKLASDDPAFVTRGADTIQSLLAMILYYAQPSIYAQALRASNVTATNTNDSALAALAAEMDVLAPPSTPIYLGSLRYQIRVGRHSLYVYVSLNAAALLTCLAVFAFSAGQTCATTIPVPDLRRAGELRKSYGGGDRGTEARRGRRAGQGWRKG